mgnify:CR=1 FL=1
MNFYVNSTSGNVNTFHIDGSTGLGTVYGDPVTGKGIATKNYVDNVAQGLDPKASVLASTANTLAVYSGGTVTQDAPKGFATLHYGLIPSPLSVAGGLGLPRR